MGGPRNIQERTFEFGVRVIRLVDRLPHTTAGVKLGQQLVRSGTSIGANMQEADGAESKKDFVHKTSISIKEAKEAHFWLRLVDATLISGDAEVRAMMTEAYELILILSAIRRKAIKPKSGLPQETT